MTIDQIDLQDIYEFMEKGSVNNAPPEIVQYLELLDKIRGMLLRIDQFANDEVIIKQLLLVDGISRYKASKLIDEAREYFYKDSTVSKSAWRNIYADKAEKMLHFAMLSVKDAKEAIAVIKSIRDLVEIRGLNEADKDELPEELFLKRTTVYTTKIEDVGMPRMDRNRVKAFIDKKIPDLNEKERLRIYQEADILPFEAFQNEQTNPRKS